MRPTTKTLLLCTIAVAAAIALDGWAYDHVVFREIYDDDGGRLLRVMGFLPTWGVAALALYLHERGVQPTARRRALLLVGSPIVAGIVAELLKLTFRRERPAVLEGAYSWRPFTERRAGCGSPSRRGAASRACWRRRTL